MEHAQSVSCGSAVCGWVYGDLGLQKLSFLSEFNPLVREQRSGADLFYFDRGDKIDVAADVFSNEVRVLMEEHAGGNKRLAVDKIMLHGLRALEAQGLKLWKAKKSPKNRVLLKAR